MATTKLQRHLFRLGAALAPLFLTLPSYSTVIDNFDSAAGWTTAADAAGSTISISTVTGETSGQALQLNYSLAVGNYAGVLKGGFASLDLNALEANEVHFSYRATSLASKVEIKLSDSDFPDPGKSTNKVYKFDAVADDQWHAEAIPLSLFQTWTNKGIGGETNSAVFDVTALSHLSFGVTKDSGGPGSGTIRFDNFALYRFDGPFVPLVNSYDNSVDNCWLPDIDHNNCLNERPVPRASLEFPIEHPDWGSSMIVSTQSAPGSGIHSREIRYTIPAGGGYFGLAELLEEGGLSVLGTDRIEFYVKGALGNEPLKMQLKSEGMVCYNDGHSPCPTRLVSPPSITTNWQKFSIPFSSFTAIPGSLPLDLSAASEIVFLFETAGTSGRVYIDDVRVTRPTSSSGLKRVLEDFSGVKKNLGYGEYAHSDAKLAFNFEEDSSTGTSSNMVGRLDYTFYDTTSTPYAVVERPVGPVNLLAEPMVRFRFKGTGANSSIEVKLKDTDGTVYRKVLANSSNTGDVWKTATIPVDQFSLFTVGADANLKLTRVSQMEFILSRGEADSGTFTLDNLESMSPVALSVTNVGRLLTAVATPDNPFSPNGDGLKDIFTVSYTLSESASVEFKVYNLQGVVVKTISKGTQSGGQNSLTWDGIADNGERVANGLYFFVLEADSTYSGKDTFRNVVAVMR